MNKTIVQQAQLDQMWAAAEPFFPLLLNYANNGIGTLNEQEANLLKAFCNLLVNELAYRIMQREHFIRCLAFRGENPKECGVRIMTQMGHATYFVDESHVFLSEGTLGELGDEMVKASLKVVAYPSLTGTLAVVLPTPFKDAILVPSAELITE